MVTWVLDPDVTGEDPEVKGLMLWGDVQLDLHLYHVRLKKCGNCGAPAEIAHRTLHQQERRFLCHGCGRPR